MDSIRFRRQAKEEANHLKVSYGQNFVREFDAWLALLAEAAENRDESYSADGLELLRRLGNPEALNQWSYSWSQLRKATLRKQVEAAIVAVMKRCPPWEFRFASRWFTLLDVISHELQVYFSVDHASGMIVFEKFELGDSEGTLNDVID